MTTMQMNAELLRNMSIIAEDESLLKRASKYLRKLVAEKEDKTQISRKDFYASIEKGEEEFRQGMTHRIESVEELNKFLDSL